MQASDQIMVQFCMREGFQRLPFWTTIIFGAGSDANGSYGFNRIWPGFYLFSTFGVRLVPLKTMISRDSVRLLHLRKKNMISSDFDRILTGLYPDFFKQLDPPPLPTLFTQCRHFHTPKIGCSRATETGTKVLAVDQCATGQESAPQICHFGTRRLLYTLGPERTKKQEHT